MNKTISIAAFSLMTAALCFEAHAVPARPGLRNVTMPDGTSLNVRLVGDEFFHQYFTEDGFPLVQDNGFFYYADLTADGQLINSRIVASPASDRTAEARSFVAGIEMKTLEQRISSRAARSERRHRMAEIMSVNEGARKSATRASGSSLDDGPLYDQGYGLFPGTPFPAYGHRRALVLLVEYQDVKFSDVYTVDAKDYFTRMLNEDGFSDLGATGSAAQYFKENSGYTFLPQFDVFGPVTLSQNQAYYGGNNYSGDDLRPHMMAKEACDQLDDEVDFSVYDTNNDGLIDNVFVFYAGTGEASSMKADDVWPHSWTMSAAGLDASEVTYDGKRLENYTCSNEWVTDEFGRNGRPDGIGTFVHEFSHTMGLPDLYATTYSSSFTPDEWSVLDYGPYNNDGMTPPNYSAFERYALGWIKPREVGDPVSARLPVITENVCAIIRTQRPTEFFLLENRQKQGWDKYIPGHGMLVWHVDYNESVWRRNAVNNTPSHQYVDLVEADNTRTASSRAGDSFPGTKNVMSFTADTTPAMKTWAGVALNCPLTDIKEQDGFIYFDVAGGAPNAMLNAAENVETSDIMPESFIIRWTPQEDCEAIVNVFNLPGDDVDPDVAGDEDGEEDTAGNTNPLAVAETGGVTYVPGFHNRNVGGVSEIVVDGLELGKLYHYTVTMLNGLQESETVNGEPVRTAAPAGVADIVAGDSVCTAVTVDGDIVKVNDNVNVVVYDPAGRVVARGEGGVKLPSAGCYIVTADGCRAVKVIVK